MLNTRKRIVVSISLLVALFISLIGITYAYYAANITGNLSEEPSLKLTSGYLAIEYEGKESTIIGGSTSSTTDDLVFTKNFTINNSGVADAFFGITLDDIKVTDSSGNETVFTRPQDWTYVLSSGTTIIKSGTFPTSDEEIITAYPLSVGESKDLTLTVTYDYITLEEATDLGLSLTEINQTADMGKKLSFNILVTQTLDNLESAKEGTLLYAINKNLPEGTEETIPGQVASTEAEARLLETEDDYGISYVYRGNVTNNFVNYSGMCWRIVRVQGDGTVKLALADENGECNATTYSKDNGLSAFVDGRTDIAYKYNSAYTESDFIYETSDIPAILDIWATKEVERNEQTVVNLDTSKLSITEWCNDMSEHFNNEDVGDTNYSYNFTEYGSYGRLESSSAAGTVTPSPSLKCSNLYRLNNKSIGLLSADEIAFAGSVSSVYDRNNILKFNYYLMTNATGGIWYWTLSPFWLDGGNTAVWNVYSTGGLNGVLAENSEGSIRPAVVLKNDVQVTTNEDTTNYGEPGTQTNPYVIN